MANFGNVLSDLAMAAWQSVRRNAADTAFEAYDTRAARPLFEKLTTFTTTATTEQTAHLFNVLRSQFQVNGDRILFSYTFTTDSAAGDVYCRIKFAGTTLFDSGTNIDPTLGNSQTLVITGWVSRVSVSKARYSISAVLTAAVGSGDTSKQGEITGLDFPDRLGNSSGTAYDLTATIETPDNIGDASLTMCEARFVNASPVELPTGLWAAYEARSYNGAGVAVPSDGANLSTAWQDLTGNANHATVTGTPTFETNECNGEAIVRLGADSNDYFTIPSMDAFTAATILFVWKITSLTTNAGNNLGDSGDAAAYPLAADSHLYEEFATTVRKDCGTAVTPLNAYHTTMIWSASNDWRMELNAMLQYATSTNTVGSPTAPTIGFNGSAEYLKADIAAIYIDNAKMTSANISKLQHYVAQVWGV